MSSGPTYCYKCLTIKTISGCACDRPKPPPLILPPLPPLNPCGTGGFNGPGGYPGCGTGGAGGLPPGGGCGTGGGGR